MDNKTKSLVKKCEALASNFLDLATEMKCLARSLERHDITKVEREKTNIFLSSRLEKFEKLFGGEE